MAFDIASDKEINTTEEIKPPASATSKYFFLHFKDVNRLIEVKGVNVNVIGLAVFVTASAGAECIRKGYGFKFCVMHAHQKKKEEHKFVDVMLKSLDDTRFLIQFITLGKIPLDNELKIKEMEPSHLF